MSADDIPPRPKLERPKLAPNDKAGPLFGAGLLGGAVGFAVYHRTGALWPAIVATLTVTVIDYYFIVALRKWRAGRGNKS